MTLHAMDDDTTYLPHSSPYIISIQCRPGGSWVCSCVLAIHARPPVVIYMFSNSIETHNGKMTSRQESMSWASHGQASREGNEDRSWGKGGEIRPRLGYGLMD